MHKIYRFVFRPEKEPDLHAYIVANKELLTCKIRSEGAIFSVLEVREGGFGWGVASRYMDALQPHVWLEYSKSEFADATWFSTDHTGNFGYPKPENKWMTTRFTYCDFDEESGVYSHQIAPYRISQNPKNKKHFVGLHWVTELFVRSEVCEQLRKHRISGWKRWPVMMNRPNIESTVISQLEIVESLDFPSSIEGLTSRTTKSGHTIRIRPAGMPIKYTQELLNVSSDIVWSQESNGLARRILVSRCFYDLYFSQKWKGLRFEPVFII